MTLTLRLLVVFSTLLCFAESYNRPRGYHHQPPPPLVDRTPYARTWHHMPTPNHRNSNPHVFEPDRIIDHFLNPQTWLEPFRPLFEPRVEPPQHELPAENPRPGFGGGIAISIGGGMGGNRWKPWNPVVTTYEDSYEPCRYGTKGGRKCLHGSGHGYRGPARKPLYPRPGWGYQPHDYPQQAPVDPWSPSYLDHYPGDGCGFNRGYKPSTTTVSRLPETDRKDIENQVTESTKAIDQVPLNRTNTTTTDPEDSSDIAPDSTKNQSPPDREKVGFYIPTDQLNGGNGLLTTVLPSNDAEDPKSSSPSGSTIAPSTSSTPKVINSSDMDEADDLDSSNGKKAVMNGDGISSSSGSTTTESSRVDENNTKSDDKVNGDDLDGDESGTYLVKLAPSSSSPPMTTTSEIPSSSASMFSNGDSGGLRGSESLAPSSSEADILPADKGEIENAVYEKELSRDEFIKHLTSLNRDEIRKLTEKLGIKIRE